jgi:hypothetical protein
MVDMHAGFERVVFDSVWNLSETALQNTQFHLARSGLSFHLTARSRTRQIVLVVTLAQFVRLLGFVNCLAFVAAVGSPYPVGPKQSASLSHSALASCMITHLQHPISRILTIAWKSRVTLLGTRAAIMDIIQCAGVVVERLLDV